MLKKLALEALTRDYANRIEYRFKSIGVAKLVLRALLDSRADNSFAVPTFLLASLSSQFGSVVAELCLDSRQWCFDLACAEYVNASGCQSLAISSQCQVSASELCGAFSLLNRSAAAGHRIRSIDIGRMCSVSADALRSLFRAAGRGLRALDVSGLGAFCDAISADFFSSCTALTTLVARDTSISMRFFDAGARRARLAGATSLRLVTLDQCAHLFDVDKQRQSASDESLVRLCLHGLDCVDVRHLRSYAFQLCSKLGMALRNDDAVDTVRIIGTGIVRISRTHSSSSSSTPSMAAVLDERDDIGHATTYAEKLNQAIRRGAGVTRRQLNRDTAHRRKRQRGLHGEVSVYSFSDGTTTFEIGKL
jgi:hypothetical protein